MLEESSFQIIDSVSINPQTKNPRSDIDFQKELLILSQELEEIKNQEYILEEAKSRRIDAIQEDIKKLIQIQKDGLLFDTTSNNFYIEYGYNENSSYGISIFSQFKNIKEATHFCSIFGKRKIFTKDKRILSIIFDLAIQQDIESKISLSYGSTWKHKKLNFFHYFEPGLSFTLGDVTHLSFNATNGIKFKNDLMLVSQTIFDWNLEKQHAKSITAFSEKCSVVKSIEIPYGKLSFELGVFSSSRLRKLAIGDFGWFFGLWFTKI